MQMQITNSPSIIWQTFVLLHDERLPTTWQSFPSSSSFGRICLSLFRLFPTHTWAIANWAYEWVPPIHSPQELMCARAFCAIVLMIYPFALRTICISGEISPCFELLVLPWLICSCCFRHPPLAQKKAREYICTEHTSRETLDILF